MISTFAQVKTRVLALLDDPNGQTYTDSVLIPAVGEATDALYGAFVFYEIPKAKVIVTYTLAASTTSLTPATAGIADFGESIQLEERLSGSSDRYTHVTEVDDISQRDAGEILGQFEWRGDAFYFIGATTARQLRISYFTSTTSPSSLDSTSTGVDSALTFLSKYAAGVAGPRKGDLELAQSYMQSAVGSRYNDGVIGGELFRLCQPMVRGRQRVQVAPKPYSVTRRIARPSRGVFISATAQAGQGMAPQQFSTANGTITGTLDGSNATFYLPFAVTTANVYRNGVLMTIGTDCTFGANVVTFLAGQIPIAGDILTVEGWL